MVKREAVNRTKKCWFEWKKWTVMTMKKWIFITVISMHQRLWLGNKGILKKTEKSEKYLNSTMKGWQKWFEIDAEDYLLKKQKRVP